jgi:hypothetical protein
VKRMRVGTWVAGLLGLVVAMPSPAQVSSTATTLQWIGVELLSPEAVRVVLHGAPAPSAVAGKFLDDHLYLGDVEIPLMSAGEVVQTDAETLIRQEVLLRAIPERVLTLPQDRLRVTWEGKRDNGNVRFTMAGSISPMDHTQVQVPLRQIYDTFARIADVSVSPSGSKIMLHVLLNLMNPLSFDLVATRIEYDLAVGDKQLIKGEQKGFRLRSGKWSDVLITQELTLGEAAASGFAALLRRDTLKIDGAVILRTPQGDRGFMLRLGPT